ncbi:N-acetylmannosaminyltransferase [Fimbriiglobus ruber]|uniref:N-acetylmannosaminyltransferase n=1 Tax=Fimbriiglobus ruber TaxID=1908690 RepID=A0A225D3H6_9BACT|nr:N-acetylmannosaminyltransferase [Fimbriiglobus ruber]
MDVDGLGLHAVTEPEAVEFIVSELDAGRGGWCVTPNLDYLRRYRRCVEFRRLLNEATFRVADGTPLVWAAKLQGTPLPGRVAGSSLISTLAAGAARAGHSIYLLGGEPGAAAGAAAVLAARHPDLVVAGTCSPAVPAVPDRACVAAVAEAIRAAGSPDIVFIGLGSPKTEWLIAELVGQFPRTWWVGVGVSFSFLTGQVRRAPAWVQRIGLEWAFRVSQEPRRLARRYLIDGIPYGCGLLLRAAARRFTGFRPGGAHP